jgi:hypothetical protein
MKVAPWLRIPESHSPLGIPGVPDVLLCPLELQVQRTVSPGWIVTEEGVKKNPPLPTVTVTVAALAAVGQKNRSGVIIIAITAMRSEEVFIALKSRRIPRQSVAARNRGKVTSPLLCSRLVAKGWQAGCLSAELSEKPSSRENEWYNLRGAPCE